LTKLAWGGLKAGTKFGEPAPLFPRAEKDAVERMQNLEDENNRSALKPRATAGERQRRRRMRSSFAPRNQAAVPQAPATPPKACRSGPGD
jgi:hypothetical protein